MVAVGRIAHLCARAFGTGSDGGTGFNQVAKGVGRNFIKILQNQLAQIAVEQGLRGHKTLAPTLVDAVGNRQKDLGLGDAAGHGVGEEHIAALRDHVAQNSHHFRERIRESLDADRLAFFDMRPVQLVLGPALERQAAQQIGGSWFARWCIGIKTCHQRQVDNLAAKG